MHVAMYVRESELWKRICSFNFRSDLPTSRLDLQSEMNQSAIREDLLIDVNLPGACAENNPGHLGSFSR